MIDLHMHSRFSEDGEFTPEQLVKQCAACGITAMSITDHNVARANPVAERAAREMGIRYIPGIEIDCTYEGISLHVLGYGIDYHSADFARIEDNVVSQASTAAAKLLENTRALGFAVTEEEMRRAAEGMEHPEIWTGDLFAEVLLAKPEYREHPLLLPYRPGGERSDNPYVNFYWDYYSQGKPCYVEIRYPSAQEVIETIHRNHGFAVLAHPGVNLKGREQLLAPLMELGLDGIEAFSSYHTADQAAFFYAAAQSRNFLFTCGSDYHGKTKPSVRLGGYTAVPGADTEQALRFIFNSK